MNGISPSAETCIQTATSSEDGTKGLKPTGFSQRRLIDKRTKKYPFRLCCFLLLSVVLLFYVKFLWQTGGSLLASSYATRQSTRQLLSISNASDDGSLSHKENCTPRSIRELPPDGLTRTQRQDGFVVFHICIALYCFWFLAAICDDYLVPAIDQICATLRMQKDVVGATFMAAATSSPALFMNCVGTFVTKGDLGVSTIVGSAVFNVLAVPACCGIFVGQQHVRHLDWWPITRDCGIYFVTVLALIGVMYDEKIMWYEALLLVLGYFMYMALMYHNDRMARKARLLISKVRRRRPCTKGDYREVTEFTSLVRGSNNNIDRCTSKCSIIGVEIGGSGIIDGSLHSLSSTQIDIDLAGTPWHRNGCSPIGFALRWPITFLLWLTMPDSRKHPKCKYVSFLLSICWIGVISYLATIAITIIGDTFYIPDSVLGLSVLAAGMSVPEAVSSVIVTKQGQGAMGISNSIGSNTFDILLCLGLPWFVKAYFLPDQLDQPWVALNSVGLTYAAGFLLSSLFGLYVAFVANKFILDWKVGIACCIMYVAFILCASMNELNVFFMVNLPVCKY